MAAKDFQKLLDEFGDFNERFTKEYGEGLIKDDSRRFGVFVVGAEVQKQLETSISGLAAAGVELSKQGTFVQNEIVDLAKRSLDANTQEAREIRKDLEGILSLTKNLAAEERKAMEQMVAMAATSIGDVGDFGDILMEGFMDSLPDFLTDSAKAAEKFLPGFLGKFAGNTIRAGRRRKTEEAVRAERFRRVGLGGDATEEDAGVVDSDPVAPTLSPSAFGGDDRIYECLLEIKYCVVDIKDILRPKATGTDKLEAKERELEAGRNTGTAAAEAVTNVFEGKGGGMGVVGTALTELGGEIAGNALGGVLGRKSPKAMATGVAQGQGLVFDKRIGSKGGFRDSATGRFAKAPTGPAPKASKLAGMNQYAGAFATAAQGLLLLAGALVVFNFVEWTSIAKAAVALPIFLGIMALAVRIMPKDRDLIKFGKSAALLAGALAILAVGLAVFNFVNWGSLVKGGLALVGLLGIMKVATMVMPSGTDLMKFAAAAAILGVGLITLAAGFILFDKVGPAGMMRAAIAVLGIVLVAEAIGIAAKKMMPQLIQFSIATAILGVGLMTLAGGLLAFDKVGLGMMMKAMLTVLALVGVAALIGVLAKGALPGLIMFAIAMPLLALGVGALGLAMSMFEGVSIGAVGVLAATLVVLGAAIAAFAVAIASGVGGLLILAAIGLIGALGVALIPFGYAAMLAGKGMKFLGQGAAMFGAGIKMIVDSVGDFMVKFVDQIIRLGEMGPRLFIAAAGVAALGLAIAAFGMGSGLGSAVAGIGGAIGSLFGGATPVEMMELIGNFAEKARNLPQIVTAIDQLRYSLEQFSNTELNMDNVEEIVHAFDRFGANASLAGFFGMGGFSEFSTFITAGEGLLKTADAIDALGPALKRFAQFTMGEDFFKEGWFTESGWTNLMEVIQDGIDELDLEELDSFSESIFKLGQGLALIANLNMASLNTNLETGVGAVTTAAGTAAGTASGRIVPMGNIEGYRGGLRPGPAPATTTPTVTSSASSITIPVTQGNPYLQQTGAKGSSSSRSAPVGPSQQKANTTTQAKQNDKTEREVDAITKEDEKIFAFGQNMEVGTTSPYGPFMISKTSDSTFGVEFVDPQQYATAKHARRASRRADLRAMLMLSKLMHLGGKGKVQGAMRNTFLFDGMNQEVKFEGTPGIGPFRPVTSATVTPESLGAAQQISRTMGSATALTADGEATVGAMNTNATMKSEAANAGASQVNSVVAPVTNAPTVNNNQTVAMADMGVRNNESSFNEAQKAQYGMSSNG